MIPKYYSIAQVADILGISKETLRRWDKNGKLVPKRHPKNKYRVYHRSQLEQFEQAQLLFNSNWDVEVGIKPDRDYTLIELFAGAGGLAIGLEKAGFQSSLLNEIDKKACETLRKNRPEWNVVEGDIAEIDFSQYRDDIDIVFLAVFHVRLFHMLVRKEALKTQEELYFSNMQEQSKRLIQK